MNQSQKSLLVRFLYEADLMGKSVEESEERQVIEAVIDLRTADLRGADLSSVELSHASLMLANLSFADLRGANLSNSHLALAHLNNADLSCAKGWTNEQLAQAESLVGATMPDGEERSEELKKSYRH